VDTPDRKTRWQNAFVYALVTTVMLLSAASVLSAYFGEGQRQLADRVDQNAKVAVAEARQTRDLLCAILINAESPDIREAVRLHCEPPVGA
jgi:hypothetical protein